MARAAHVMTAGHWSGPAVDTVVLDHDNRHRRRLAMTGEGGLAFLLDLAEATTLRDGDGLRLEDGRIVAVKAAAEPLAEIGPTDPAHLVRIAWHLGNRHLPTQLLGERLLIRRDHVIEAMLVGLGATVTHVEAPFDPEGGAYGHGETHGHSHGGHHHSHA
ncbi:MAG: urease accessory protein UreE [Bauldia litoralis]|uniref:urease accessory protein UreE n=1 Tax=Bauldia litoralis TaxID=665467 RepID=UPI003299CDDD